MVTKELTVWKLLCQTQTCRRRWTVVKSILVNIWVKFKNVEIFKRVQIFVLVVLIFVEEIKAVNVNNRLRASNQNKVNEENLMSLFSAIEKEYVFTHGKENIIKDSSRFVIIQVYNSPYSLSFIQQSIPLPNTYAMFGSSEEEKSRWE